MKTTLFAALTGLLLLSSSLPVAAAPDTGTTTSLPIEEEVSEKTVVPTITGEYGASIDAITGELYYGKNEHEQAFPASITKALTVILADEYLEENQPITISKNSALQEPSNSQLLLKENDVISKEDAMEMLMILSSNDVAYALAEEISGSVEEFAVLMNERAKELGAKNSNFVTPNGLPNELHKTTAYDMAMIGREWLNHPLVLEIIQREEAQIKVGDKEYLISPKHHIFKQNPNAIGGKTGWTNASGNTLLEILQKGDQQVVTVVMKTSLEKEYDDINIMSDFAFENFKTKKFYEAGETVLSLKVNKEKANLIAEEPITASYQSNEKIENKIVWDEKQSFKKGETAAWLTLLDSEGKEMKRFPLAIDKSLSISDKVKSSSLLTDKDSALQPKNIALTVVLIIGIPLLLFFLLYSLSNRKKRVIK